MSFLTASYQIELQILVLSRQIDQNFDQDDELFVLAILLWMIGLDLLPMQ